MKLENERLSVEISEVGRKSRGSLIKRRRQMSCGRATRLLERHSPILFPNVGKTYHNVVLINGTHYPTSHTGSPETVNLNAYVKQAIKLRSFWHRAKNQKKSTPLISN